MGMAFTNDFKRFKTLTSGHHIIMGRKTFESPRPLPNRTHVIITRQDNYAPEGCIVVNSMDQAVCCPRIKIFFYYGGEFTLGIPLRINRTYFSASYF
jgi:dihydrofolate reductase